MKENTQRIDSNLLTTECVKKQAARGDKVCGAYESLLGFGRGFISSDTVDYGDCDIEDEVGMY